MTVNTVMTRRSDLAALSIRYDKLQQAVLDENDTNIVAWGRMLKEIQEDARIEVLPYTKWELIGIIKKAEAHIIDKSSRYGLQSFILEAHGIDVTVEQLKKLAKLDIKD